MISFKLKGNFKHTENFLREGKQILQRWRNIFRKYADEGLRALQNLTPKDSGLTAESWYYQITKNGIIYRNRNIKDGIPIVILLQYGHATRSGKYIQGIDFINPAIKPIFEKISEECWKEVTSL